jgi:hypothetical protein
LLLPPWFFRHMRHYKDSFFIHVIFLDATRTYILLVYI